MSSGEDDAPLPDESEPSYDGYKRSSSEEEGDAPIYPVDDISLLDAVLDDLTSQSSFDTDKFPLELIPPRWIPGMGATLGALNREVFDICETSRRLINQIYRTDRELRSGSHLDSVFEMKHDCYTSLKKLNNGDSGLKALLRKICLLGGPYYRPPDNLWHYLYFFWYESEEDIIGKLITPVPGCAPPDFHNVFCGHTANIVMIMDALKQEEFATAPELDEEEDNKMLMEDFKSLSLMAQKYWKSHLADSLPSSTTKATTAGLYTQLLRMMEMTEQKISDLESRGQNCCKFPTLLQNALNHFKEKK